MPGMIFGSALKVPLVLQRPSRNSEMLAELIGHERRYLCLGLRGLNTSCSGQREFGVHGNAVVSPTDDVDLGILNPSWLGGASGVGLDG